MNFALKWTRPTAVVLLLTLVYIVACLFLSDRQTVSEYAPSFVAALKNVTSTSGERDNVSLTNNKPGSQKIAWKDTDDIWTEEANSTSRVLLVTQYRGGSTFLGQVFNQNPEMFYWFEPLRRNQRDEMLIKTDNIKVRDRQYLVVRNSSLKPLPRKYFSNRLQTVRSTLNCDVESLAVETLLDAFLAKQGKSARAAGYVKCLRRKASVRRKVSRARVRECLPKLARLCKTSQIVVVKVIRLNIYMTEQLLAEDPSLKVVYYVRDPRGIMNSRLTIPSSKNLTQAKEFGNGERLCLKMARDLEEYGRLHEKYPKRTRMFKYEDLASQPNDLAKELYKFIGRQEPEGVNRWIEENTKADSSDGTYGTKRNATSVMSRWKMMLDVDLQKRMKAKCIVLLKKLGYEP